MKLCDVSAFKTVFEMLNTVLPEANWEFKRTEEIEREVKSDDSDKKKKGKKKKKPKTEKIKMIGGMKIVGVDSSQTILINLKLDEDKFAEFECKKKSHVIGVNMVKFFKMIKGLDKDDSLTMYVDSNDSDMLHLEIENSDAKKGTDNKEKSRNLSLMDLDEDPYKIPPADFEARIVMSSNTFSKECKDISALADLVEIQCTPTALTLKCKDHGDSSHNRWKYDPDKDDNDVIIEFSKKAKTKIIQGIFELKHLVWFNKCAGLCDDIEIFMKNDYPLVLRFMVASLGKIYLCVTPITPQRDDEDEAANFEDEDEDYDEGAVEMVGG